MRKLLCLAFTVCVIFLSACAQPVASPKKTAAGLVFLTRVDCVNTPTLAANLESALETLGLPSDYQVVDLDKLPNSDARTGYPTPTLLYRNRDLFGLPAPVPPFPQPT